MGALRYIQGCLTSILPGFLFSNAPFGIFRDTRHISEVGGKGMEKGEGTEDELGIARYIR